MHIHDVSAVTRQSSKAQPSPPGRAVKSEQLPFGLFSSTTLLTWIRAPGAKRISCQRGRSIRYRAEEFSLFLHEKVYLFAKQKVFFVVHRCWRTWVCVCIRGKGAAVDVLRGGEHRERDRDRVSASHSSTMASLPNAFEPPDGRVALGLVCLGNVYIASYLESDGDGPALAK